MSNQNNGENHFKKGIDILSQIEEYMEESYPKNMADLNTRIDNLEKIHKIKYDTNNKSKPTYYQINSIRTNHTAIEELYNSSESADLTNKAAIIGKINDINNRIIKFENEGEGDSYEK